MKINDNDTLADFLKAVDKASGNVYLKSQYGDVYNLKSMLSRYVAIAALLGQYGDELELFCDHREDEALFFGFFSRHKEVLD